MDRINGTPDSSDVAALRVIASRDTWNGAPIRQYDFLMTPDADPVQLGSGNVRVLVSVRKHCSPHVKWVWVGTRRRGWATAAYRWLVREFGHALKVSDVCGDESLAFHERMKVLHLVSTFTVDAVFKRDRSSRHAVGAVLLQCTRGGRHCPEIGAGAVGMLLTSP